MKKIKHIHFVGIKGVGMTPLAIIAKEAGIKVTGSDLTEQFITDKALKDNGIVPFVGFDVKNVGDCDLVITTGAHGGYGNVEVIAAKNMGIPVISKGEAVGVFMKGEVFGKSFIGISVAGTHGKTTTTAIIATIFSKAGVDPSYVIGTGSIPSLTFPGHFGKGKYFIAEADEYATEPKNDKTPQFLWQHPKIMIVTNIEHDHPDLYPSLEDVIGAFRKFLSQLSPDGTLIACGEDRQIQKILSGYTGHVITYGFHEKNDYQVKRVSFSGSQVFFWVDAYKASLGEFNLRVSGSHNVLNATAAIIAATEAGLSIGQIKNALPMFSGSRRRMEYIGVVKSGAMIYDDYAHHPTEIQTTLRTLKSQYPKKKIICVFQPHTYSRTKKLLDQFSSSFSSADVIAIAEIYPSQREEEDLSVSGQILVDLIKKQHKDALFLKTLADVVEYINTNNYKTDSVIIFMGAGDIYKVIDQLDLQKE